MRTGNEIRHQRVIVLSCFVALSAAFGCDPNIDQREQLEHGRVEAVFDPATSTLPLPNGVAVDATGKLPSLLTAEQVADPNVPGAEKEFSKWFSSQNGWPTETPIEIPFSGKLNEETVNQQNIMMFQLSAEGVKPVAIDKFEIVDAVAPAVVKVRIIPASAVLPDTTYTVVVSKQVEDEFGNTIVEPLPIFFAGSTEPLIDSNGDPTVSLLEDQPDTAKTLEGLRQAMQPLFAVAQGAGVARDQVAMLFGWSTTSDAYTVLDPVTATIPLPNTIGLDADGTFPRSALCSAPGEKNALSYLEDYLGGLNGWPATTPIVLPLSGPVDESTLTKETVQLWRLNGATVERVDDYTITLLSEKTDRCTGVKSPGYSIALTLPGEMDARTHYFAFATREIKGANGSPLLPPAAMAMAVQPYPVLVDGKSTMSRVSTEQAQAIAGVQQVLAPTVAAIEEATGLKYDELASVWSWFTWLDTFVVFDPAAGQIPFPNSFLIDQATGLVKLPIPAGADPLTTGILTELNRRHGFSLSAPGWIPLDGKLAPASVTTDSVRVFLTKGLLPTKLTDSEYAVTYEDALDHLVVTPLTPYAPQSRYVGVITESLMGSNGRPVQPTAPFVLIRSPKTLFKDGKSTVPGYLSDEAAEQLEAARIAMEPIFMGAGILAAPGKTRESIASAWAFDTDNATRELQELRAEALYVYEQRSAGEREFLVTDLGEIPSAEYDDPNHQGLKIDMGNVDKIYKKVEFKSVSFLDYATGAMKSIGDVQELAVGVSVFVPKKDQGAQKQCDEPYDVVIGGHGLNGDRLSFGLAAANELAAYPNCLALITMDLPLHGGRAPGVTDLHPPTRPANSGEGFLSPNLLLSKGLFEQAAVDLSVLTRVIKGNGTDNGLEKLIDSDSATKFFSDKIGYLGMSMGGIVGTTFITVEPDVSTAVLNVTGGKLTWLLEGTFGQGILQSLAALGVEPGTFLYLQTLTFIQWVADVIDPFTFAPFTSGTERLEVLKYDPADGGTYAVDGEVPVTNVMMQMAVDDRTIPNRSTELLADTIGVSLDNTTFTDVSHGFFSTRNVGSDEYPQGLCARKQAAQWLSSGLSGTPALEPELYATACVADQAP